jgi:HPt (histidine-containing phosphotransfer) domain-containing protein
LLMEARSQSHEGTSRLRIAQLLDLNVTQARLGGDENLVAEVAHVFVQTVPQLMSAIRSSLSNDDFDTICERVTALKGAIAAVEAPVVSHLLADIEIHARTRNRSATAVAFGMAQALVDRLVVELAMYSARGSATVADSGEHVRSRTVVDNQVV